MHKSGKSLAALALTAISVVSTDHEIVFNQYVKEGRPLSAAGEWAWPTWPGFTTQTQISVLLYPSSAFRCPLSGG